MEFPKVLVIRHFSEVLGMKYLGESGDVLWFEDGLNKVAVGVYFSELYEEAELYKRLAALVNLNAAKIYLAILQEASAFIDPRFLKNQGIGLVVVDPTKGAQGVDVRIYAKARQQPVPAVNTEKLIEAIKAAVLEQVNNQIKALESSIFEKLKRYIDQRLEEYKGAMSGKPPPLPPPPGGSSVVENEWVRYLRSRGK
ncbi:hypothetical protein [Pyrobaculum aerophilum]|uniref:Actin-like protein n=2 Tax=Pyrobaculum aerophilum TaxID=13773 RepID=Q8ZVH5_PYRAE|nr:MULTISPECIES: hypothetical protein [Pyrobaculum]AAL64081.1 actin-like protein [Pyrobaculum aerophilum str. IM2]MCX8135826.1 hypothetical protein [Pyrobaculum aerophilum]HII47156.1 hypothetical protein [Pyrobaculum aerophilum]